MIFFLNAGSAELIASVFVTTQASFTNSVSVAFLNVVSSAKALITGCAKIKILNSTGTAYTQIR